MTRPPRKDIFIVQGAQTDWNGTCGAYCNEISNDRGLKLLEFATYSNLVLANTLATHKPSRKWTWHSTDGKDYNQIDYILMKNLFQTGVNIARTRSITGAYAGSNHNLVMMTFTLRLKKRKNPKNHRISIRYWKAKGSQDIASISSINRWKICSPGHPWCRGDEHRLVHISN